MEKRSSPLLISFSADSSIDLVSAAGSVLLVKDFVSELSFTRIDFWGRLPSCPNCRRQLILPSELAQLLYYVIRQEELLSFLHNNH
jgi:hypothetical protein